jgi:hypothetical protein
MLAHGFTIELINAGLASASAERVVAPSYAAEIASGETFK